MGEIGDGKDILVRVHSECLTGDALHSIRCDCAAQRDGAMATIANEGRGVFLYLHQEGRGIGLANKLRAYALQDRRRRYGRGERCSSGCRSTSATTASARRSSYDLGVREMRLITNNPKKIFGLEGYGLRIVDRVPIATEPTEYNARYMDTKREKMGHLFDRRSGDAKPAASRKAQPPTKAAR